MRCNILHRKRLKEVSHEFLIRNDFRMMKPGFHFIYFLLGTLFSVEINSEFPELINDKFRSFVWKNMQFVLFNLKKAIL